MPSSEWNRDNQLPLLEQEEHSPRGTEGATQRNQTNALVSIDCLID